MRVEAILFDLGDIFFEAHLWRKWLFQELEQMGFYKGTFADFYNLYDSFLMEHAYVGKKNYTEVFNTFIKRMGIPEKEVPPFVKDALEKKLFFEKTRTLYPDIKDTLQEIQRRGIKTAVITDNESVEDEIRQNVIGRFGINNTLDKVITSKDCGFTKPDPRIFTYALQALGTTADRAMFVGHDADEIAGAKKVGLKTVEFNNYLGTTTNHDVHISTFSELLPLCEKL